DHQRVRERPRLAGEVVDVAHRDTDLFAPFAAPGLFEGFTRLDETRQRREDLHREARTLRQQHFVATVHDHDDRGSDTRILLQPAYRAAHRPLAGHRRRARATPSA